MRLNERERTAWLRALRERLEKCGASEADPGYRETVLAIAIQFESYLREHNPESPLLRLLDEHRNGQA